jgi:hypothetical protein
VAVASNPFSSLGQESLRSVKLVIQSAKARAEQRLVHLAVRESASAKDLDGFSLILARQAGKVEELDSLLGLVLDAERPA